MATTSLRPVGRSHGTGGDGTEPEPPVETGGGPRGEQPGEVASEDTVSRLVAAAADVFAEKGYERATVAEIARRAGLTTGAIYSRFTGKAELLAAAIGESTMDEFDRLFADHRFQGRAADLLETVGAHLVQREASPGQALLLEAFVAARRHPEVEALLQTHLRVRIENLRQMVEDSKATGLVNPDVDSDAIVHFAHAVGFGFLLFEAVGLPHPRPDAWIDLIHRIVTSVAETTDIPP